MTEDAALSLAWLEAPVQALDMGRSHTACLKEWPHRFGGVPLAASHGG